MPRFSLSKHRNNFWNIGKHHVPEIPEIIFHVSFHASHQEPLTASYLYKTYVYFNNIWMGVGVLLEELRATRRSVCLPTTGTWRITWARIPFPKLNNSPECFIALSSCLSSRGISSLGGQGLPVGRVL